MVKASFMIGCKLKRKKFKELKILTYKAFVPVDQPPHKFYSTYTT